MDKELKFPFYAKASLLLVGAFALISMLYIARGIIVPFLFSVIAAIVLHPVVNFLVSRKVNKVVAIGLTLFLSIIIIAAFGTFLISQVDRFVESLPKLIDKFIEILNNTIIWISDSFDVSPRKINSWLRSSDGQLINTDSSFIGSTLATVGGLVVVLLLIPVYIFMLLFYHPLLIEFFRRLFGADNRKELNEVITQIKTLIQRYLIGLLMETAIIAVLYTVGLLILGIEYAIVLGILGALLNLIPYIGSWIAASMPMMIAIVTKSSSWVALLVLALYVVIQLIDNNYIVPKIVASKVKINALVSIIAVIAFGTLWGIPGMLIAIPLTAIIKLILDHIEPLKPWGFLLGDAMPKTVPSRSKLKSNKTD